MRNMNNYDDNNPYLNQDFNANDGFDDFEEPFDATKAYSSSFDNQYNSSQNMYGNGSYTNSYVRYNDATSLNVLINKILTRSFFVMLIALLISAFTSEIIAVNVDAAIFVLRNYNLISIATLVIGFIAIAVLRKENIVIGGACFIAYSVLIGATFSIFHLVYPAAQIASVFVVTACMFGGMAILGLFTKIDFLSIGGFLIMGLWGIIIATLLNSFIFKSGTASLMIDYVGVMIFLGLVAYDLQKIKKNATYLNPNDTKAVNSMILYSGMELYLDFINLFIRLLSITSRRR